MLIEENRPFNYAVLASLVLHAAVLFAIKHPEPANRAQPQVPIIARLVEPPEPPAVDSPPATPPQAERMKPRARAKPAPKPPVKAGPAPQPELIAPQGPTAEPEPQPAPVTPPSAVAAEEGPAAPAPERVGEAPLPAHTVGQYRLEIMSAARKSLRYPPLARENNWEGRVALRIVFSPSGRIASLNVTRTSGYEVLDKQAVEMYRNAAAAVPVPPVLRGKEFAIEVAAAYELKD
jgi:protein TonB